MLVLTRGIDESIIVSMGGEQVRLSIVDVRGSNVRIGFTAPKSVRIDREEVHQLRMDAGGTSRQMDLAC